MTLTKPLREQIERIERAGFGVTPMRFAKGGHLVVRVRHGKRSGLMVLGSSPGDRRSGLNAIRCARQACGVA